MPDTIEILNPMHPVTEKLTMFVKAYLKMSMDEDELKDLSARFDHVLDLAKQLIESGSGTKIDTMIQMSASWLASKWKLPYDKTIMGLVLVEGQLKQSLKKGGR
jgi:hypothetical protein